MRLLPTGSRRRVRTRDDRGVVLPSAIALLGAGGVLAAGGLLVLTEPGDGTPAEAAPVAATRPAPPVVEEVEDPVATETTGIRVVDGERLKKKKPPKVVRSEVYVEIYNNSGIVGLASDTAARAQGVGWNVVAADNWYGAIAAPTVYYPPQLEREARTLATDLGVDRVVPSVAPMGLDRLTVILTAGY